MYFHFTSLGSGFIYHDKKVDAKLALFADSLRTLLSIAILVSILSTSEIRGVFGQFYSVKRRNTNKAIFLPALR